MSLEYHSESMSHLVLPKIKPFSQRKWREYHYSQEQRTLCAGLSYFWLIEKIHSRSAMAQLEYPSTKLLYDIDHLQSLSYYPNFPRNFIPGKKECSLLKEKYGTDNWEKIQAHVEKQHQGDFILYDLWRMFSYQSASIERYINFDQLLSSLKPVPPNSAVILVLRYIKNDMPCGHRMAYYFDKKRQHHFFDSNEGEVIESNNRYFSQWLSAFFNNSHYKDIKGTDSDYFLTLYKLNKVSINRSV